MMKKTAHAAAYPSVLEKIKISGLFPSYLKIFRRRKRPRPYNDAAMNINFNRNNVFYVKLVKKCLPHYGLWKTIGKR
ncbi:MAG: hypothetical protein K5838_08470 [Elusimicrobiales bacterium]|nr:hypothetical protein [Elusimicrobiales bacterium]